jgi:hypothetical protein
MVKVIVAEKKINCEHLIGQFVDESHYDHLLEEDCDVYMPANCDLATQADMRARLLILRYWCR